MTPPEQSGPPKAPRQPVNPPAIPPAARGRGQEARADAASSAASPNEPGTAPATGTGPAGPGTTSAGTPAGAGTKPASAAPRGSGGAAPTVVPGRPATPDEPTSAGTPDQVTVLQTVVNELATPAAKTAAAPKSGYTPRVFAFERPPKKSVGPDGTPNGERDKTEAGTTAAGGGTGAAVGAAAAAGAGVAAGTVVGAAGSGVGTPDAAGTDASSAAAGTGAAGAPAAAATDAAAGAGSSAGSTPSEGAPSGRPQPENTQPENTRPENTRSESTPDNTRPDNTRPERTSADGPPSEGARSGEQSGSKPSDTAGADGAGSEGTGTDKAGTDKAGTDKVSTDKAAADPTPPGTPSPVRKSAAAAGAAAAASVAAAGAASAAASPSGVPAGAGGPVPPSASGAGMSAPPSGAPVSGAGTSATPTEAPASGAAASPAASASGPGTSGPGASGPGTADPKTGPGAADPKTSGSGSPAAATPADPAPAASGSTPPEAPVPAPAAPAVPPSVPPRSLIPPSGPGAVPPPGPGAAPDGGQNSFLRPLTGAIQRVSRWAPVNPGAAPMAAPGPGPVGPNGPAGPAGPGAPTESGGFYGLAGDGAPSRGPRIALFAVLAAVVLFGVYSLVAWGLSDRVPNETTVAGVNVGGMTQAEAASVLTEQLGPRVKEPIALTAGEGKAQLSPEPSGLAIDAEATAAQLTGFSLSPMRMWAHMFGGSEEELVLAIDSEKFDAAVAGLEESLAVEPVDGTVSFVDGQPAKTDPKDGSRIVASETSRVIQERWLHDEGPFDLPIETVEPKITQQETDDSFAVAQKVVSAPVTVSVGGQKPVLTPAVLAGLVRFEQRDDVLVTIVDREAAVAAIVDGTTNLLEVPDDAHFEFVGGRPTVVEGRTGTTLDPAETGKAVRIAATSDDRETSVELVEQDPKETVESLEALGVKEIVSEFSTPLTNEPVRTQNLVRGAQMVTGNLVKPGETFSLLEALAPITLENGYFDAGVVENGEHVEAVGGGLSQMATTSFNAGFFAGFEDIEHHAHSYWFPRYPAGREATIYVGAKDMKFKNDTPYGAVLQAFVSGGELTVRVWSTKYYTVQESTSPKRNIVPKTTIHDSSADCQPYPGGEDGFSVTISRKVLHDGQVVKENSFNHSYNPDNPVVCDGPKGSDG